MKRLEKLDRLRMKVPVLLLVPALSRGINLIFTPFILQAFGNQGFIEVSILTLMSFLLSVTIELGMKQKVLMVCRTKVLLIAYFAKWLFAATTFLIICTFVHFAFEILTSASGFLETRDLVVVCVDALINVTLNSFYLGYLQAKGRPDLILRTNYQCLLLVIIPRVCILVIGITEPSLWVLLGSIFRLIVFVSITKELAGLGFQKLLRCGRGIHLFDKGSLNSIFGLITVLILTIDKFVGTHLYDSSTMVAYILAFQFVSMSGSLFEQILVKYFRTILDALMTDYAANHLRTMIFGFLFVVSILNGIYSAISVLVFPELNPIFFPILCLLSFQPLAWGVLIIWQNVIGPITSNMGHVKYMGIALVFDSLVLSALYLFRNLGVLFLAAATASTFLVCIIGLSFNSQSPGINFVPRTEIFLIFAGFIVVTLGLHSLQSSLPALLGLIAAINFLLGVVAKNINFIPKIREIVGVER